MTVPLNLLQSNSVATSASAPTSITATLNSPSKPNTFLAIIVSVSGSAIGVTAPLNWIKLTMQGNGSTIGFFLLTLPIPNNPGGITSQIVTLTGTTGGGAVACMMEFSGTQGGPLDSKASTGNTGTSPGKRTPLPTVTTQYNELFFYILAHDATATLTATGLDGTFSVDLCNLSSTLAATLNVTLHVYWSQNTSNENPGMTTHSTLSASVIWVNMVAAIFGGGGSIVYTDINGVRSLHAIYGGS